MISRTNWRAIVGATAALTLASATAQVAVAQEKIKVGIVAFHTGAAAGPFGIPSRNAAESIIAAINKGEMPAPYASKGVAGLEIEPVYVDEAGGTTKQVTEYRNMIQRQGVEAVVGYISSGSCLAVAPVAEELNTFTVLFDCGTPRIFEDFGLHLRLPHRCPRDSRKRRRRPLCHREIRRHRQNSGHQPELRLGAGFVARLLHRLRRHEERRRTPRTTLAETLPGSVWRGDLTLIGHPATSAPLIALGR